MNGCLPDCVARTPRRERPGDCWRNTRQTRETYAGHNYVFLVFTYKDMNALSFTEKYVLILELIIISRDLLDLLWKGILHCYKVVQCACTFATDGINVGTEKNNILLVWKVSLT